MLIPSSGAGQSGKNSSNFLLLKDDIDNLESISTLESTTISRRSIFYLTGAPTMGIIQHDVGKLVDKL